MVEITVGIEGMACGMCEAHINEAVRNAFQVKKVSSSHTKKRTVIIAEQDIPEQELKDVVAKAFLTASLICASHIPQAIPSMPTAISTINFLPILISDN